MAKLPPFPHPDPACSGQDIQQASRAQQPNVHQPQKPSTPQIPGPNTIKGLTSTKMDVSKGKASASGHLASDNGYLSMGAEDDSSSLCVVCLESEPQLAFAPCQHAMACKACAARIAAKSNECPVCRSPILDSKECMMEQGLTAVVTLASDCYGCLPSPNYGPSWYCCSRPLQDSVLVSQALTASLPMQIIMTRNSPCDARAAGKCRAEITNTGRPLFRHNVYCMGLTRHHLSASHHLICPGCLCLVPLSCCW